jgi:hydrogenase-4 component F
VPFVLVQKNLKRLLAYSTIDQAGIMAAALGIGGKVATLGLMLHMTFHSIAKPLLFFCAGNIGQRFKTDRLQQLKGGLIRVMPVTGAALFVGMLAIVGLPPLSLFQSEFLMVSAAFGGGHSLSGALFVLFGAGLFAGMALHVSGLVLGPSEDERSAVYPWREGAVLALTVVLVVIAFWLPGSLLELVRRAAAVVTG